MSRRTAHPLNGLPRLRVELVPSTCWMSNVRSYMSEHFWRKLSREIAEDSGERCMVCRGRGRRHAVECHEAWHYDDVRRVQMLMRLDALCPICHSIKHLGRTIAQGKQDLALDWLAKVNEWDAHTTRVYVDAVFEQWRLRSQVEWTLDLRALGEVYEVSLGQLGLESYVLVPRERKQMQHRYAVRTEGVPQRDGGRYGPQDAGHRVNKNGRNQKMPRQTREATLPKPPAPTIDWEKIARSGRVWEFIEGEDFNGKASSYRARAKTAARKLGVDFDSTEVQRGGKTVLKILAFKIDNERHHKVSTPTPAAKSGSEVSAAEVAEPELRLIP